MTTPPPRRTVTTTPLLPLLVGVAAAVAVLVVAFVGIGALVSAGREDDRALVDDAPVQRVSAEAYESVELKTPKEEVMAALRPAEPVDVRILDRYEERSPETVASSCVYFDSEGVRVGALYRFCFEDDVLVDKTVVLPADGT